MASRRNVGEAVLALGVGGGDAVQIDELHLHGRGGLIGVGGDGSSNAAARLRERHRSVQQQKRDERAQCSHGFLLRFNPLWTGERRG
jgi:hypothetical protein